MLLVLHLRRRPHDGAKVVVVDALLVGHHELAPPVFARLALELVLVDGRGRVEVGEVLVQVLEDLVVDLGQAQLGAGDFFEDGPVCLEVLDGCGGGRTSELVLGGFVSVGF